MLLPSLIQTNVPLHDKNWFRTGGPAAFYAEPTTEVEFAQAVTWAHSQRLPVQLIGAGANMLIADQGFAGLIIRPALQTIAYEQVDGATALVTAGAGVDFGELINFCLQRQALGLEEFSGIPGTVGGSVFINIHYFEFLLSQFIVTARVIHAKTGLVEEVGVDWFKFGYNYSTLHLGDYYVLSATFKLRHGTALEAAYAQGRQAEMIRTRGQRYPKSHTCGSFFRNFFPEEVTLESAGKKMIYVAYYLDKLGIKGQLSVGDAIVSYQHANMLFNKGAATTQDLITLARTMQQKVFDAYSIIPQPECRLVGFSEHPLLNLQNSSVLATEAWQQR